MSKKKEFFMKSTKNVLMTGVALAIALFASVQVFADLTDEQKKIVKGEVDQLQEFFINPNAELRDKAYKLGNQTTLDSANKRLSIYYKREKALTDLYYTTKTYQYTSDLRDEIKHINKMQ
jgi:TRAP-type C4-dicarboxylate transport system substrate-binding protein